MLAMSNHIEERWNEIIQFNGFGHNGQNQYISFIKFALESSKCLLVYILLFKYKKVYEIYIKSHSKNPNPQLYILNKGEINYSYLYSRSRIEIIRAVLSSIHRVPMTSLIKGIK